MEVKEGTNSKVEDEDRLSMLPDDILLSILGRVDITTAVRTSALSMWWCKHLPWLLWELTIDVKDFLPVRRPNPIEAEHIGEATSSITKVTRSFLATPGGISRLQLKLYLINKYACDIDIGALVGEAIDTGILKDLNLSILDEQHIPDCTDEKMMRQASVVKGFFSAYPSVFHCLTRLSLYNLCFAKWNINHYLFDCCNQLEHLYISDCDAGLDRVWKIDAPDSKLSVLQLNFSMLGPIEIVCLPKLERLEWDAWNCPHALLSFGLVPSLKELYLIHAATNDYQGFVLSEVLSDTTSIHTMELDFQ